MIRSCRIPPILNRICDDVVHSALLVTADGELLGASTKRSTSSLFPPASTSTLASSSASASASAPEGGGAGVSSSASPASSAAGAIENLGTLIADIAVDYQRLGEEYVGIDGSQQQRNGKSQLQCLLMELELGLVAVSSCGSFDCLVIAIASPNAPLGLVKAKIQTLAVYVQEALSPLAENT